MTSKLIMSRNERVLLESADRDDRCGILDFTLKQLQRVYYDKVENKRSKIKRSQSKGRNSNDRNIKISKIIKSKDNKVAHSFDRNEISSRPRTNAVQSSHV